MRLRANMLLIMAAITTSSVLAVSSHRHAAARSLLETQHSTLDQTIAQATELLRLRAEQAVASESGERITSADAYAVIEKSLVRAGLDAAVIDSLRPGPTVRGSSARAGEAGQTIVLQLNRLHIHELGAFLAMWGADQHHWPIDRIELRHNALREQNRFDVSLTFVTDKES